MRPRQTTLPVPFVRGWLHPVSRVQLATESGCVLKCGTSMGYAREHSAARKYRAHDGAWDC